MIDVVLGIDPGLDGAFVWVSSDGRNVLGSEVMPVVDVATKKNGKKATKSIHDEVAIRRIVASIGWPTSIAAFIEKQQTMMRPDGKGGFVKEGAAASFTSGEGYGLIRGILCGLQVSYETIPPKEWQAVMLAGMPRPAGKKASRKVSGIVCGRLWPEHDWRSSERAREPHGGKADAALIGEYGRRRAAGMVPQWQRRSSALRNPIEEEDG